MKIAIIIPIYNQADYLQHCLDSLLNQTDGDFTVYCVNDGSTDNSQEIIDGVVERDGRFVAVQKPNGGLSSARNAGLDAAAARAADAYLFLDSDDFLHPQCIEFVRKAALANPGCVVEYDYTGCTLPMEFLARRYVYSADEIVSYSISSTVWNKLYPKEVIGSLRFSEDVLYAEDFVFTTELALKFRPSCRFLPHELHYYTTNPNSMSRIAFDAENFRRRAVAIEYLVQAFVGCPDKFRDLVCEHLPSLLKRFYRDLRLNVRPDGYAEVCRIFAAELASLRRRGFLHPQRGSFKDLKYYFRFLWLAYRYGGQR